MQLGYPIGLYGAERWIIALVKHLDPIRVESIVSALKDDPALDAPICREAAFAGFQTHIFEAFGKVNFSAVRKIRDYIKRNDIDILHTHGYKVDMIGLLATIGTKCRVVATPHGWSRDAGIKLQVYEFVDRAVFPFFDAVAPLSAELFSELRKIPGLNGKLRLITNGVDIGEIDAVTVPALEIEALRAEGNTIIGYVGQLITRKGLDILLRAFGRLSIPKKRLYIVGGGDARGDLESLVRRLGLEKEVFFGGFREDRLSLLKGFDIFVLPSRLEGIPRCIMEAMVARVPVVASNIPGCRDVIIHEKTGLLFKTDNVDSLSHEIGRILSNPILAETLRNQARIFVEIEFSALKMARRYAELYSRLVSR